MGPFEKIVDKSGEFLILGVGLVGPGLCLALPLKNPWRRHGFVGRTLGHTARTHVHTPILYLGNH